jgi:hypothetical protein
MGLGRAPAFRLIGCGPAGQAAQDQPRPRRPIGSREGPAIRPKSGKLKEDVQKRRKGCADESKPERVRRDPPGEARRVLRD